MRTRAWSRFAALLALLLLAPWARAEKPLGQLMREAEDDRFQVRESAAREIGERGREAESAALLLDKLLYDQAPRVRQAAAGALARIGGPNATRSLLSALGHEDPRLRRNVVQGLKIAPDASLRLLTKALVDQDSTVREHAVKALAVASSDNAVPLLAQAASKDDDSIVREKAMEGLGDWAEKASHSQRQGASSRTFSTVVGGLIDPADRVRMQAVRTLAILNPFNAIEHYEQMLDDRSPVVRGQLFETLANLGGKQVLGVLAKGVQHRQVTVRGEAVEALAKLGKAGLSGLIQALADQAEEVRWAALRALPKPAPPVAIPTLVRLVDDPVTRIRVATVEALEPLTQNPQADTALRKALKDHEPQVRRVAVRTAGAFFGDKVVDVLSSQATDADRVVARVKLDVIAAPATSRSASVLAGLLKTQKANTERVMELILGMPKYAAGALVGVLKETPDPALRQRIVEILGTLGDKRAAPDLRAIVSDASSSDPLRLAAVESLASLGDSESVGAAEALYVSSSSIDEEDRGRLLAAITRLGGSPRVLLEIRRNLMLVILLVVVLAGLVIWQVVLRPMMADRAVKAEADRMAELEARANEPRRIPTEDEFLADLNVKLQGDPARKRRMRYQIQRGLIRFIKMDFDGCISDLDQVTRTFAKEDDSGTKARVFFFLGKAALGKGDKSLGQRRLSDALGHYDRRLQSDIVSQIAADPGNLDRAIELLEKELPYDDDINVVDVQKLKV